MKENSIVKSPYNILEVIQIAINIEKDGIQFYTQLAKKTKDKKVKEIFLKMAGDEELHVTKLDSMMELLSDVKNIYVDYEDEEYISSYLKDISDNQVFAVEDINKTNKGISVKDALEYSLRNEDKAINFYTAFKKYAENQKAQYILDLIIAEEQTHKVILNELISKL